MQRGPGIAYLIEVSTKTTSTIIHDQYWDQLGPHLIIRFPAGSHDMLQFSQYDITQRCEINVVFGSANIAPGYTADQWVSIVVSTMHEISWDIRGQGPEDLLALLLMTLQLQDGFIIFRSCEPKIYVQFV
jgi:hypothetical protein